MKTSDYNLIEKYLDGTATPEEFAVLEGRLRMDPALRLALLQEAGFEGQLRILLRTAPLADLRSVATDEAIDLVEPEVPFRRTIQWRPAWLWIPLAAAAAALVAALLIPRPSPPVGTKIVNIEKGSQRQASPLDERKLHPADNKEVTTVSIRKEPQPAIVEPAVVSAHPERPVIDPLTVAVSPQISAPPEPAVAGVERKQEVAAELPVLRVEPPPKVPRQVGGNSAVLIAVPPEVADASTPPSAPAAGVFPAGVDGQIVSANGRVYLTRMAGANRGRHELQSGESFLPGDMVEAGAMSGIWLRYTDGATVRLYGNTQLTLNRTDLSRNLSLASGAVDLRVPPLGAGSNLTVSTSFAQARVAGTDFRVMTDDKATWVGVRTGRVEVVRLWPTRDVVLLNAGHYAASFRGWAPTPMDDPNWRAKCLQFTGSPKYQ